MTTDQGGGVCLPDRASTRSGSALDCQFLKSRSTRNGDPSPLEPVAVDALQPLPPEAFDIYFDTYEAASAAVATPVAGEFFQQLVATGTPFTALFSDIEQA